MCIRDRPYISTADLETLMGNFKSMCQFLKALFLDAIFEVVHCWQLHQELEDARENAYLRQVK